MKIPQTKKYSIYKNLVLQDMRSRKLNFEVDGRVYYVYRITDIITNVYYYGTRISKNKNIERDFWSYCTSSKKKNIIKENKSNYKVKIIKIFDNPSDMMIYESFLHQYFNVKAHKKFWNEANQTPFGFCTAGKKKVINNDKILMVSCENTKYESFHKGKVPVKNSKGETLYIKVEDPRYGKELMHVSKGLVLSQEKGIVSTETFRKENLTFHAKNKVTVKDKDTGETLQVDTGYNKLKYEALSKNKKMVRDKKGNTFRVDVNNNEYEGINKNKIVVTDKKGNKFSIKKDDPRLASGELVSIQKNRIICKNKKGDILNVFKDDPRWLSGELVGIGKGMSIVLDLEGERKFTKIPTDIVKNKRDRYVGTTKKINVIYKNRIMIVSAKEYINNIEYKLI